MFIKESNRVILNNNAYKSSEYKDILTEASSGIYHKIAHQMMKFISKQSFWSKILFLKRGMINVKLIYKLRIYHFSENDQATGNHNNSNNLLSAGNY